MSTFHASLCSKSSGRQMEYCDHTCNRDLHRIPDIMRTQFPTLLYYYYTLSADQYVMVIAKSGFHAEQKMAFSLYNWRQYKALKLRIISQTPIFPVVEHLNLCHIRTIQQTMVNSDERRKQSNFLFLELLLRTPTLSTINSSWIGVKCRLTKRLHNTEIYFNFQLFPQHSATLK